MRMLIVSIVIGPLVLIGALPAVAGRSTLTLRSGAPVLLTAGNDTPADRNTYTQQTREEMQEWHGKLHDFSEQAEAKGKEAANAVENDLNKAWTKAEAASSKLQTVGAGRWESAKTSLEEASRKLTDPGHRMILPQDK